MPARAGDVSGEFVVFRREAWGVYRAGVNHLDGLTLRNRYLGLRHGQSEANQAGIVLSSPAAGIPFYGLTAAGREQVRASVAASSLEPHTLIVSSDFARAHESALLAREVLSAGPVRLEQALRERFFGDWERKPNTAYAEVWAQDLDDPAHTQGGVESAAQVTARTTELVAELEREHEGRTFLLVGHGDPLQLLLTAFLGLDPASHRSRDHWQPGEIRALCRGS
jgi:probable phosphoglycerate mutase